MLLNRHRKKRAEKESQSVTKKEKPRTKRTPAKKKAEVNADKNPKN